MEIDIQINSTILPVLGGNVRSSLGARFVDARARTTHTDRERETPFSSLFVPAFHASFLCTPRFDAVERDVPSDTDAVECVRLRAA